MLPIRHRSIFKSRWVALAWAGGIIWSAIEFASAHQPRSAPSGNVQANGDADAGAADAADVAAAKQAVNALEAIH